MSEDYYGPKAIPTVDIAATVTILSTTYLILGKRNYQGLFRFPGGHVDVVKDKSYLDAALREFKEETGLECSGMSSLNSSIIHDPRYINKPDKIFTTLFECQVDKHEVLNRKPDYIYNVDDGMGNKFTYLEHSGSDDLDLVVYIPIANMSEQLLVPEHRSLWKILESHLSELIGIDKGNLI